MHAFAQAAGTLSEWEPLLDRYELICRKCIDLRQRKDAGEQIAASQLLSLMDQLEALRGEIKQVSDKMPAAARRRFYAIREMYSTGVVTETRLEALPSMDAAIMRPGATCNAHSGNKDSSSLSQKDANLSDGGLNNAGRAGAFSLPDAQPLPVAPRPWPYLNVIAASASLPELAGGLRYEHWGRKLGFWVAARSTFSFHQTSYNALSDGSQSIQTPQGASLGTGRIWASGNAATDRLFVTAGPMLRVSRNLALFGGAGYGYSRLCWEDWEGNWMLIEDRSHTGVCFEAGASVVFSPCVLSLSWLSVRGHSHTACLSVGFCF